MKIWFRNLLYSIQRFFKKLYVGSYGMDDINKILIYVCFGLSILNIFAKNVIINILSNIFFIAFIFRYFSKNKISRSAENRAFRKEIRFLELKKQYYKTHKVFKCKKCGQFIKVPRGIGKIETTCPNCGNKEDHRA